MLNENFVNKVVAGFKEKYAQPCMVNVCTLKKNNGVNLTGIYVKREGKKYGAAVYLDSYYTQYRSGRMTLEEIIQDIHDVIMEQQMPIIEEKGSFEFEAVKDKIMYKLINWKRNRELLANVPYVRFLDLAVVFYLLLEKGEYGQLSVPIQNKDMVTWGTSAEELYQLAEQNMPAQEPWVFRNMDDMMREFVRTSLKENYEEDDDLEKEMDALLDCLLSGPKPPLYILTNESGLYGAAVLLYPKVLQSISSEVGGDLIILPSSIHETIVLLYEDSMDEGEGERLKNLVRSVNEMEVPEEDFLSDSIYCYRRTTNRITALFTETEKA